MSLISFVENAGEKLVEAALSARKATEPATLAPSAPQQDAVAGAAIAKYVASQKLSARNLNISYNGASKTVTVRGLAPDQATKEKIVLCCGNVSSVAKVDDQLFVSQTSPAFPPSTTYEVKPGDTLSKIAETVYGEMTSNDTIFEANKPMLTDPDNIYPGQQLRIPPRA